MNTHSADTLIVRALGVKAYERVWEAMRCFTDRRDESTADEVWMVEHPPVFTQGQAGRAEHIHAAGKIPVVQVDRGGQVTYHGPGQQIAYLLFDIRRLKFGVRDMVSAIEQAIIATLAHWNMSAKARSDAPGVYINEAKIAALGLRIRRGCSFHGLALNVNVNLEPFSRINPCGYQGMQVTRMSDLADNIHAGEVATTLTEQLARQFGYIDKGGYTIHYDWDF